MRKLFVLVFLIVPVFAFSQNFEGSIKYSNSFKQGNGPYTIDQLKQFLGTELLYSIRNGDYKSVTNSSAITYQLYDHKSNRLYNKTPASDTLYWFDASVNSDSVIKYEILKNADTVLGEVCDVLKMQTVSGSQSISYSSKYRLAKDLFKNHSFNNWSFYANLSGAVPLRFVIETAYFEMTSTAIEIKQETLNQDFFALPPDVPVRNASK